MKYVIVATSLETGLSQDIGPEFSDEKKAEEAVEFMLNYYDLIDDFSLIVQER